MWNDHRVTWFFFGALVMLGMIFGDLLFGRIIETILAIYHVPTP